MGPFWMYDILGHVRRAGSRSNIYSTSFLNSSVQTCVQLLIDVEHTKLGLLTTQRQVLCVHRHLQSSQPNRARSFTRPPNQNISSFTGPQVAPHIYSIADRSLVGPPHPPTTAPCCQRRRSPCFFCWCLRALSTHSSKAMLSNAMIQGEFSCHRAG